MCLTKCFVFVPHSLPVIRYKVAFAEKVVRNICSETLCPFSKNITVAACTGSSHVRRNPSRYFLRATNNQKSDSAKSVFYGEHGKTSSLIFCIAAELAKLLWSLALYVKVALAFPLMETTYLFLQLWSSCNSRKGVSGH